MKKMLPKFIRKHGPFAVLEIVRKTCEAMAEERAEGGIECKMESEGYKCSAVLHMYARAVKKCQNDVHRYKSCPCWVGGKAKWL
jgi:hypothetical protein